MPPLYVVCDAEACARAGWTLTDFASACLDGGATLLQVRGKSLSARELFEATTSIVERAASGASVIVNDRADIALFAGASGVHVGQDDVPVSGVRRVVGTDMIVGFSTHTTAQIDAALAEPISYLAIGPVFDTTTKMTGYDPVGLARVHEAAQRAASASLPVVAIGGITIDNAGAVLAAGAASVAVISDLLVAGDPEKRTREFIDRLEAHGH